MIKNINPNKFIKKIKKKKKLIKVKKIKKYKLNKNEIPQFNEDIIYLNKYLEEKNLNKTKNNKKFNNFYYLKLNDFLQIYNEEKEIIIKDPKTNYRYFGYRFNDIIKNKKIPDIKKNSKYEAVLIEFRILPNLEFVLRNAIIKLGEEWSHTIICGLNNYEYMLNLCEQISKEIKVIQLPYTNLNQSTYSLLLASIKFWKNFVGEKILIYQEDSCIFKNNINDFIEWDYIGAPWSKRNNDNKKQVGNGGLSLRTKDIMIKVIEKKNIIETKYNSHTLNFMKSAKMTVGPEDVYFTINMLKYNIGKVADWDDAFNFSTETMLNTNSFGGHSFWLSDKNWKKRLIKDVLLN